MFLKLFPSFPYLTTSGRPPPSSVSPLRRVIWFNTDDICGVICAFYGWAILLYALLCVNRYVIVAQYALFSPVGMLLSITFSSLIFLSLWSHIMCMCTDPGAIPLNSLPPPHLSFISSASPSNGPPISVPPPVCVTCEYTYKPKRAHHCSTCKRCISHLDHHCPWMNNCVGIANQKYFILFCLYVALSSIFAVTLIVCRIISCEYTQGVAMSYAKCFDYNFRIDYNMDETSLPSFTQILSENLRRHDESIVGLVNMFVITIFSFIFGIFTLIMMISQLQSIYTESTQIEQWKKQRKEYSKLQKNYEENMNKNVKIPIANSPNHIGERETESVPMRSLQTQKSLPSSSSNISQSLSLLSFSSYPMTADDAINAQKMRNSHPDLSGKGVEIIPNSPSSSTTYTSPITSSSSSYISPSNTKIDKSDSDNDDDVESGLISRPSHRVSPLASPSSSFPSNKNLQFQKFKENFYLVFIGNANIQSILDQNSSIFKGIFQVIFVILLPIRQQWKDYHEVIGVAKPFVPPPHVRPDDIPMSVNDFINGNGNGNAHVRSDIHVNLNGNPQSEDESDGL